MSITVELSSEEIAQMTRLTNLQDGARRWPTPLASFCGFVGSGNSCAMSGHVDYDDNWQRLESLELAEVDFPR